MAPLRPLNISKSRGSALSQFIAARIRGRGPLGSIIEGRFGEADARAPVSLLNGSQLTRLLECREEIGRRRKAKSSISIQEGQPR